MHAINFKSRPAMKWRTKRKESKRHYMQRKENIKSVWYFFHVACNDDSLRCIAVFIYTVDSLYLDYSLSRLSLYLELISGSPYGHSRLFFFLYLELSISRTKFLVPWEFEIERFHCIIIPIDSLGLDHCNLSLSVSNNLLESVGWDDAGPPG